MCKLDSADKLSYFCLKGNIISILIDLTTSCSKSFKHVIYKWLKTIRIFSRKCRRESHRILNLFVPCSITLSEVSIILPFNHISTPREDDPLLSTYNGNGQLNKI